jgi:glycosyltransferase involved in cell wall biosynthesis
VFISKKNIINNSICFAGGISSMWKHEIILEALKECPNTVYVLCGHGSEEYLRKLHTITTWAQVDFKGRVPHEEVKSILENCKVGIAIIDYIANCGGKRGTLGNTKIFEYMQAGIPVICTNFALWKEIVEDNNCGICVNPNNISEIANAIKYLLDNPKIASQMGKNGQEAILKKYNWDAEEKKLFKLYQEIYYNDDK